MNDNFTTLNESTQEVGTGDLINTLKPIVVKGKEGVTSFRELQDLMIGKNGKLNGRYKKMDSFFMSLQVYLLKEYNTHVDPIKYLWYLYYNPVKTERISTLDIYDKIGHLGDYIDREVFVRMFSKTFNWKLRNSKDVLNSTKKKLSLSTSINVQCIKDEKKERVEKIMKILVRISKNKDTLKVDNSILKNKRNNVKKIQYLLNQHGYIGEESFEQTIIKLSDKYGTKATSSAINHIIRGLGENIQMNKGRISEMKKNYNL